MHYLVRPRSPDIMSPIDQTINADYRCAFQYPQINTALLPHLHFFKNLFIEHYCLLSLSLFKQTLCSKQRNKIHLVVFSESSCILQEENSTWANPLRQKFVKNKTKQERLQKGKRKGGICSISRSLHLFKSY